MRFAPHGRIGSSWITIFNTPIKMSTIRTLAHSRSMLDSAMPCASSAWDRSERLFGVDDQRAGVGFEFALSRNTRLTVGGLGGFDPVYLPDSDFYGDLTFDGRPASFGVLVRRAAFQDSDFWIAGPELTVKLSKSADASLAYYHGNATPVGLPEVGTDTVAVRLGGWVTKEFRLGAGIHPRDRSPRLVDRRSHRRRIRHLRPARHLRVYSIREP